MYSYSFKETLMNTITEKLSMILIGQSTYECRTTRSFVCFFFFVIYLNTIFCFCVTEFTRKPTILCGLQNQKKWLRKTKRECAYKPHVAIVCYYGR